MSDGFRNPSLAVDAICLRSGGSEVLLIKRGRTPWKGKFAFPGGFVDYGEDPEIAVLRELLEETGIDEEEIELLKANERIKIEAAQYKNHEWNIFPFLFKAKNPKIKLNWENSDFDWIEPNQIKNYETVPELEKILFSLF